jgi:hypothetical protein
VRFPKAITSGKGAEPAISAEERGEIICAFNLRNPIPVHCTFAILLLSRAAKAGVGTGRLQLTTATYQFHRQTVNANFIGIKER